MDRRKGTINSATIHVLDCGLLPYSELMGTLGTCLGPRIFFLFQRPPTGCGEINFLKLIILLLMLLHDRTNNSKIDLYSKGLFLCCAGIVADNSAINAANFLP